MGKLFGWLIGTTVGRWVGVASIGALLIGGFVWLQVHDAKVREGERAKLADENTQKIEEMRAADRAKVQEKLDAAQEKIEAAERRMQASLDREARLVQTIASLSQQRSVVAGEVSRVTDSELHAYNVRNLGIRPEGTTGIGCYLPIEERAIATALTQLPLCEKQVAAQSQQISEIKEQVAAQTAKIDAMEVKFESLAGYTDRLEGYYRVVWEAIPRKGRKAWPPNCWIFKCNKKVNLPVPAPLDLKKPAP